jgi:ABC-type sugar transport system ATPase subunit
MPLPAGALPAVRPLPVRRRGPAAAWVALLRTLNMSVYENVAAGLRPGRRRYPKPLLDEVVERSLRAANLWTEVKDRLRAQVTSQSGGQQQQATYQWVTATADLHRLRLPGRRPW